MDLMYAFAIHIVDVNVLIGNISDQDISLQHQQPGCHLPGHPEGQLEPCTDRFQGPAVHLLPLNRLQSTRPTRRKHRTPVPEQPRRTRPHGPTVDQALCHLMQRLRRSEGLVRLGK